MTTTRSRGTGVAVALALLTIVAAVACVDYDPRAYDGTPELDAVDRHADRPVESATPVDLGSASHVVLAHAVGDDVTIDVADGSGTLLEATSGVPAMGHPSNRAGSSSSTTTRPRFD